MIRVNEDYVILIEGLNYTPCRDLHKTDKKGAPVYKVIGYYSNLEQAVKCIIKDMVNRTLEADTYSLQEAVKVIQQSNDAFTDMLREVLESGSK